MERIGIYTKQISHNINFIVRRFNNINYKFNKSDANY